MRIERKDGELVEMDELSAEINRAFGINAYDLFTMFFKEEIVRLYNLAVENLSSSRSMRNPNVRGM